MAIANIRSHSWRRTLLIAGLVVLPVQAVLLGVLAAWDDMRGWPALVREIWRDPV